MEHPSIDALAQIAYNAYGDNRGLFNYDGNPIPLWEEVPLHVRIAWQVAVEAVLQALPELKD